MWPSHARYLQIALPFVPAPLMERVRVTPATIYRHVLSAGMIALALLVAWLLFDLMVTIGVQPPQAFWGTLLVVASPPLSIYAIVFFTELVSALCALAVFRWIVVRDRRHAMRRSGRVAGAPGRTARARARPECAGSCCSHFLGCRRVTVARAARPP